MPLLKKLQFRHSWKDSLIAAFDRKVVIMLFLGFSAGLPLLLIFSSLSLWLREAGVDRSVVTYFSWAALGYSFKFVWAPLVDRLPIPVLTRYLGLRRSWLLLAQLGIVLAITLMAMTNPADSIDNLTMVAVGAVLLGFSSATQDIVNDAYRIDVAEVDLQAMMSASYIAGYRVGMIVAGAGALYLAQFLGSTLDAYSYVAWKTTYHGMSLFMLVGIITTLVIHEPKLLEREDDFSTADYGRLVIVFLLAVCAFVSCFFYSSTIGNALKNSFNNAYLMNFLIEFSRLLLAVGAALITAYVAVSLGAVKKDVVSFSYISPIKSFFENYGAATALLLLCLVGLYRISDIVLGVISNVFYQDMGFSKDEIASAVKVFGLVMAIAGGFLGGIMSMRYGVMRMLFVGAVLVVLTNLLFISLLYSGHNLWVLYTVVAADNLVAGLASAAFIAFLSGLVDVRFTAMQYAIFSSLMTLIPKVLGGYSGSIVDSVGYQSFFLIAALLGVPVLLLIYFANKSLRINE